MAAMLSRIAESMFWIGRYVERAEDTARILDVQTQLLLEDAGVDEETDLPRRCSSIMGVEDGARRASVDMAQMLDMLAYDPASPASIAVGARRRPGERPPGPRDAVGADVGGHQHDLPRDPVRPVPRAAAAGDLPLGARPRGADQRHRRRDDDPRRGLALPDARPLRRARRHDLAAGRDRVAGRRQRRAVDHARCARAAPTRRSCAPTAGWRPSAARRSSCCSTGSSRGRWCSRSTGPSSAWTTSRPSRPAGRLPERGAAAARPHPRRAGVPLAHRRGGRPARRDGAAAAHLRRRPPTRSPGATSPAPRPLAWQGEGDGDEHAAADRAHDRLRVRRQGGRVVQPGADDAA